VFEGGIEAISGRVMTGWITAPEAAVTNTLVTFYERGEPLGSAVATGDAASLVFEFLLPRALFDGERHELAAGIDGQRITLRNASHRLGLSTAPPGVLKGWLETVTDAGMVRGWALYPERPDERVEIEVLVDGLAAGCITASLLRADLREAGYGDGHHGFAFALPYLMMVQPRAMSVTARDRATGQAIGEARPFRQKAVTDALTKIGALEGDVRLLSDTLRQLETARARDDEAIAELFRTIAEFFTELGTATVRGEVPKLRQIGRAVSAVTDGFAPFAFAAGTAPALTVCVDAAGPVTALYDTLAALQATGGDGIEVLLMDDGACEDTPLLPLIAQNLRYARHPGSRAALRYNNALTQAAGEIVVFLTAPACLQPGWRAALAAFTARPKLSVMAGRVTGPDGLLLSAGAELGFGVTALRGEGADPHAPDFAQSGPVDAAATDMFAVRRASWLRLGGLDEGFAELAPALALLCANARAAGDKVTYEPGLAVSTIRRERTTDMEAMRADTRRLRAAMGDEEEVLLSVNKK